MLRRTIFNVNKTRSIPKHWRGVADDKSTKYPSFLLNHQRIRWNSTDGVGTPSDDEPSKKRKQPKLKTYVEMKLRKLNMKKGKLTEEKHSSIQCREKCQKIIDEIFKEGDRKDKALENREDASFPKTDKDLNLKAVANTQEEERKLTQKIEKINEVPIVVAQHEEEFNTTPKTLSIITSRPNKFSGGYSNVDKAYDDLASQCLKAAPTRIDDALLDGMNKLLYESIKTKVHHATPKKREKKHEVECSDTEIPLLKEHSIPHPAAYLFNHVNFNVDAIKEDEHNEEPDNLMLDSRTFVFDFINFSSDEQNESENTLEAQPDPAIVDGVDKTTLKACKKKLSKVYLKLEVDNYTDVNTWQAHRIENKVSTPTKTDESQPHGIKNLYLNYSTTAAVPYEAKKEIERSEIVRTEFTQLLKEDTIPHPATYLFNHVYFNTDQKKKVVDDAVEDNAISDMNSHVKTKANETPFTQNTPLHGFTFDSSTEFTQLLKEDTIPHPATYLFNHVYFNTDQKKKVVDDAVVDDAVEDGAISDMNSHVKTKANETPFTQNTPLHGFTFDSSTEFTQLLKEDTIPHPATYLFNHVYFNTDQKKKVVDDAVVDDAVEDGAISDMNSHVKTKANEIPFTQNTPLHGFTFDSSTEFTQLLKEDTIPHPATYLFNHVYFNTDEKKKLVNNAVKDGAISYIKLPVKAKANEIPYTQNTSMHGLAIDSSTTDAAEHEARQETDSSPMDHIECARPLLKEYSIPHQATYLFDHITSKIDEKKEHVDVNADNFVFEKYESEKNVAKEDTKPPFYPNDTLLDGRTIRSSKKDAAVHEAIKEIEHSTVKYVECSQPVLEKETILHKVINFSDQINFKTDDKKKHFGGKVEDMIIKDTNSVKKERKELLKEEKNTPEKDTSLYETAISSFVTFEGAKRKPIKSRKKPRSLLKKRTTSNTGVYKFNKNEKNMQSVYKNIKTSVRNDFKRAPNSDYYKSYMKNYSDSPDWLSPTVKNKSKSRLHKTHTFSLAAFDSVVKKKPQATSQKIERMKPEKTVKCSAIIVKKNRPLTSPIACTYNFKHSVFNKTGSFSHLNLKTFLDHHKHYSTKQLQNDKQAVTGETSECHPFSCLLSCTFPDYKEDKSHNVEQSKEQHSIKSWIDDSVAPSHGPSENLIKAKSGEKQKPDAPSNTNVKLTNRYGIRYQISESDASDEPVVRVMIRETNGQPTTPEPKEILEQSGPSTSIQLNNQTRPVLTNENVTRYEINNMSSKGASEKDLRVKTGETKAQTASQKPLHSVEDVVTKVQTSSLNISNQLFSEKLKELKLQPISFKAPAMSTESYLKYYGVNYKSNKNPLTDKPVATNTNEEPDISNLTNKDLRENLSEKTYTAQGQDARSSISKEALLNAFHSSAHSTQNQDFVKYHASENDSSATKIEPATQNTQKRASFLRTQKHLSSENVEELELKPMSSNPVESNDNNLNHYEIQNRNNENKFKDEPLVRTMSVPKQMHVSLKELHKVPEGVLTQEKSSSFNTSNQVIGSGKVGELRPKPITFTTPMVSNVDYVHRSAINYKNEDSKVDAKDINQQSTILSHIENDPREKLSAKRAFTTPLNVAGSEISDNLTLRPSGFTTESESETKEDLVVKIRETKEPLAIPEHHDPKAKFVATKLHNVNLVTKISSHPVIKHKPKAKSPQTKNLWHDIISTDEKIIPKEQVKHLNKFTPYAQRIDNLTFEPPDVKFDQPEINAPPSTKPPNAPEHTAARTLIVSAEIDSDSRKETKKLTDHHIKRNIKLPLPNDMKMNEKHKCGTMYFTREDQKENTVLKIEMDKKSNSIPQDFKNAKEIVIKLSNQDVCNKSPSKEDNLIVQELRVITHDKTKYYQPVKTGDILQSHDVAKDSKSEQSFVTTNTLEHCTDNSSRNVIPFSSHVDEPVKTNDSNDSFLTKILNKLRPRRRVEHNLDGFNEHKAEFAECGRTERPKCPPQPCPPRLRCPKRPKKKKYLNRSSCKPKNTQSSCPKQACSKKTPTCKSKSRASVCRPHVDNPPPKSPCARFSAIDPSAHNTAVIDLKSLDVCDLENLFNSSKAITESLILHLRKQIEGKHVAKFWNYKNFDPWVPIPSYEKQKKVHRIKVPKHAKPGPQELPPPEKGPCLPRSKTFPKLTFSFPDLIFVTRQS